MRRLPPAAVVASVDVVAGDTGAGDSTRRTIDAGAVATPPAPPALTVQDLGKEYRLYASPRQRLKALLTGRTYHRSHWALQGVSFELHRGQCLGVIGDNGAGKSSLLKMKAGTMQPSVGRIARVGRVTAILELGAGFHPDFSGRDNLYFGGSLIGISSAEMERLEASIIEFSELGDAIDRPVKTYSSGMSVRLAFALVTAVEPEVLIIDEALAVGDQHFQKKCIERIMAFRKSGCTILFCSHSPYHIRHLCDVALWLDGGQVKAFGATEPVLGAYEMHTRLRNRQDALEPDDMPDAGPQEEGAEQPAVAPAPAPAPRTRRSAPPRSSTGRAARAAPRTRSRSTTRSPGSGWPAPTSRDSRRCWRGGAPRWRRGAPVGTARRGRQW